LVFKLSVWCEAEGCVSQLEIIIQLVCRLWSLVLGFQVVGVVWSWGLCVQFAGCCSSPQTGHTTGNTTTHNHKSDDFQEELKQTNWTCKNSWTTVIANISWHSFGKSSCEATWMKTEEFAVPRNGNLWAQTSLRQERKGKFISLRINTFLARLPQYLFPLLM
jgi:hypothetical protein